MPPTMPMPKPAAKPITVPTAEKTPLTPDVQLQCLRYSPSGQILAAAGCDGSIRRWTLTGTETVELPKLTGHHGWVSGLVFHPDSQRLYSADSWGRLIAWDIRQAEAKPLWQVANAHDGWIRQLALSPDGQSLATVGYDGWLRIWSTAQGAKVKEFARGNEPIFAVAFHPTGDDLVTGTLHAKVTRWNLATGKPIGDFPAAEMYLESRLQDTGGVRTLAFSPTGDQLFIGGSKPSNGGSFQGIPHILSYDWKSGKRGPTFQGTSPNEGLVYDMQVHPQGYVIAVTSGQPGNGRLIFWMPGEEKPRFVTSQMPNCHSLTLHPAGNRLAVAATNTGSNGNGKVKGKDGEYPANYSPIYFWNLPERLTS